MIIPRSGELGIPARPAVTPDGEGRFLVLLLLGAPGAGKGTQARRLAEALALPHMASGDFLRRAMEEQTPFGRQVRAYVEAGQLVPDELLIPALLAQLEVVRGAQHAAGVILDGFPRTRRQAQLLHRAGRSARDGPRLREWAFVLDVPDRLLLERLTGRWSCVACGAAYHEETTRPKVAGHCDRCGQALTRRTDDQPATIRQRLALARETLRPLTAYYRRHGALSVIDGALCEDRVVVALLEAAVQAGATVSARRPRGSIAAGCRNLGSPAQ